MIKTKFLESKKQVDIFFFIVVFVVIVVVFVLEEGAGG